MKRETEEQRKAKQAIVDKQVEAVRKLLPTGWNATEGFFLSLSGGGSPPHISVCRKTGSFSEELKAMKLTDPVERSIWKKGWYHANREKATEIKTMLESKGYSVQQDYGTLYIKIK